MKLNYVDGGNWRHNHGEHHRPVGAVIIELYVLAAFVTDAPTFRLVLFYSL